MDFLVARYGSQILTTDQESVARRTSGKNLHTSWEAGRVRICFAFCVHDYVYTHAMAAEPAQASNVRELVDELVTMVGEGWCDHLRPNPLR